MGDIVQFKPKKDKKIYIVLAVLIVATAILLYINIVHSAYTKSLNLNKSAIMSIFALRRKEENGQNPDRKEEDCAPEVWKSLST